MNNKAAVALNFSTPFSAVVNFVCIESQRRESEERDWCLLEVSSVLSIW